MRGLRGVCPRCGQGKLFAGIIKVSAACENCHMDFSDEDSGDGPAAFLIFFISVIAALVALAMVMMLGISVVVTVVVISLLIIGMTLASLRPSKGVLIALQYFHGASDSGQ